MTNQILFNTTNSLNITNNPVLSTFSDNSKPEGINFQEMLSTLLNSSNQLTKPDSTGLFTSDMTPILLLLFSKLFGEDLLGSDTTMRADSPQGVPLNGPISQNSHIGHTALDFGVPVGTRVHSTMSGKVTFAGWNNEGYGNLVIVENGEYKTYYAHLSSIPVKVGQIVNDGTIVGLSGNTGNSTGPHLHYEIRKNGIAVSPITSIDNHS